MTHPDRYGAWRTLLPPIHPDGWPFIALAIIVTVLLFAASQPLGWLALIVTLWVSAFFRDPWRVSPQSPGLALAPADGEIVTVDRVAPPPELEIGSHPMLRIEIFLSLIDVHINRMPLALVGKVYCKVDAGHGAIEIGDLLTTSPTPGHAMKAADPMRAFGAVIGKALRPLASGTGLIPILVALQ